jgi:hypothetical protein
MLAPVSGAWCATHLEDNMKKLTLHRETLRLVSSSAPARNRKEQGTAAASYENTTRYCPEEPESVSCFHSCRC